MYQILSQSLIMVLHKSDSPAKSLIFGSIEYLLKKLLAVLVILMGLSGKDYLYRSPGIIYDLLQSLHILQKQSRPLVRRKPSGKSQSKSRWIKQNSRGHYQSRVGCAAVQPLEPGSLPNPGYQQIFHGLVVLPKHFIRDFINQFPNARIVMTSQPIPAHISIENYVTQPAIDPRRNVNAIGNMIYRHLFLRKIRP